METIVIVLYLLCSFAIIGLIMLQQGKGAEAGASFGQGASATVFGSQGSGNFFSRLTGILAAVFFVLAFGLTVMAKQRAGVTDIPALVEQPAAEVVESDVPALQESAPADSDVPVIETAPAESEGDVPALPQE